MKRLSNQFFQFLQHSNLIISLAAVSLILVTRVLIGAGPRFHPDLLMIFGACMTEYNLHRLIKYHALSLHDRKLRYQWLYGNLKFAWGITLFSLLVLTISLNYVSLSAFFILIISGIAVLSYSIPPKSLFGKYSLRKVPFLKTFLVAMVWTIMTVLIPITESYTSEAKETITLIFAGRFLLIFSLALLFDIRDIETDRENGIQTIPVVLGQKLTLKLLTTLVVLFVFSTLFYPEFVGFNFHLVSAFLFALFLNLVVVNRRTRASSYYYPIYLDGSLIVYSLLVIIGWFIFA